MTETINWRDKSRTLSNKVVELEAQRDELLEALKDARRELEQIAMAEIGEKYNNPKINAAITKAEGGE